MKKNTKELELVKTIILNGKIAMCFTGDDQDTAIGILTVSKQKRFDGSYTEISIGYPFVQRLENEIGWAYKRADVTYIISDESITDPEKTLAEFIKFVSGDPSVSRYHKYSDLTGYLWTEEKFKVGGHDLLQVLNTNHGKFIHIEIDLYH